MQITLKWFQIGNRTNPVIGDKHLNPWNIHKQGELIDSTAILVKFVSTMCHWGNSFLFGVLVIVDNK